MFELKSLIRIIDRSTDATQGLHSTDGECRLIIWLQKHTNKGRTTRGLEFWDLKGKFTNYTDKYTGNIILQGE